MASVHRALHTAHLVHVASALRNELNLDVDGMCALRLPVDLLDFFPEWQRGSSRGFRPRALGITLSPDAAARPLRAIRLQTSPSVGGVALAITLVTELRRRLDPHVRLVVLLDPTADLPDVRRKVRHALGSTAGIRFLTAHFNTIFARDNALAARDRGGRPTLVVPRRVRGVSESDAESLDRDAIRRATSLRVITSRFDWQGGNILFDGETLAVGADTIAENATRLGLTHDEVTAGMAAEFGAELTILGDVGHARLGDDRHRMSRSGQASYHLDLDVSLLGRRRQSDRPVALVADQSIGLRLLAPLIARGLLPRPAYLSAARARAHIDHEYRTAARERAPWLQAYRDTLAARGYEIVSAPELRTRHLTESASGLQDFAYCNVLPGLNRGRAALHFLPMGVTALDAAASRAYQDAGVHPVRIARTPYLAAAMMERAAGLRCFCGAMP